MLKIPVLGINVDERFLQHRRRSTSLAALAADLVDGGLLEYHLVRHHVIRWDLAAILLSMVVVKLGAMTWYHFTD